MQSADERAVQSFPPSVHAIGAVRLGVRLILNSWPDFVALAAFLAMAIVIDRDLLTAGDYPRGEWGEWLGHAYRVQLVKEYGISTWDHVWTGGVSPFQTYQFVPHVVTAIVSGLAGASVGRSMLVLEACLLFWLRCSGYVTARLLGLPRVAALLAGVMTFGARNYAPEVLTFSTLWGLALVPLLVVAAWRYRDAPQSYVVAAIAGLSMYVHPHAALAGVMALIAAFLVGPMTKERLGRLALQGAIVVLATAFFWVPSAFSAKPPMQDPASADVQFLRGIFQGDVDLINDLTWAIVPVVAIVTLLFWPTIRRPLLRYMMIFLGIALFLVAVSDAGVGPESVRLMQSVRLVNLFPLGLGLMAAIAADAAMRGTPRIGGRGVLLSAGVVATAGLLFVPMFSFATDRGYDPAWYEQDALTAWFERHNNELPGRVWMEGRETSWYTFHEFGKLRSVRSSFPQADWSLLARPLQEGILVGYPDWQTTEDYLKAMAVSYLLVPDNASVAQVVRQGGETSSPYQKELYLDGLPSQTLYKTPWDPVVAFFMGADVLPPLDFPREQYKSQDERKVRDRLTHAYAEVAYSPSATPVAVEYPSPTTMRVRLAGLPLGQRLVISENWDRSWRASTSDGKDLPVHRYGPSYIEVDVSQVSGNVVIELRHEMSSDWKFGIALTLLSMPLAAGAVLWERRRKERQILRPPPGPPSTPLASG